MMDFAYANANELAPGLDVGSGGMVTGKDLRFDTEVVRPSGFVTPVSYFGTVPSGALVDLALPNEDDGRAWLESMLENIAETFGIDRTTLAQCCLVTRAAMYRWLGGESTPSQTRLDRLYRLNSAASMWKQRGYPKPGIKITYPVLRGNSLLDLLKSQTLDVDAIEQVGRQFRLEALSNR